MNKIKMLFVALGAMLLTVTLLAVPAHAEDGQHSARYCVAYDGSVGEIRKEMCAQVRWDTQADGTGVVLEFLDVDTTDGAADILGYTNVDASFANTSVIKGSWNWGSEPDFFTKNHQSVKGADDTTMIYRLGMCGGNDRLWIEVRLYAGGNSSLVDKGHAQNGQCPGGGGGD